MGAIVFAHACRLKSDRAHGALLHMKPESRNQTC